MYQIVLYGLNTYTSSDSNCEVTTASVSAGSLVTLNVLNIDPQPEFESESNVGVGGWRNNVQTSYDKYSVVSHRLKFPDDMSLIDTFKDVVSKRFNYMRAVSYPHTIHTAGKSIDGIITEVSVETEPASKRISFEFIKRKPRT